MIKSGAEKNEKHELKMKKFATIASITNLHKEELPTLMKVKSPGKINRCNRSERLLEMRKPTVTCRPSASMNFGLPTHASRQTSNQIKLLIKKRKRRGFYD